MRHGVVCPQTSKIHIIGTLHCVYTVCILKRVSTPCHATVWGLASTKAVGKD